MRFDPKDSSATVAFIDEASFQARSLRSAFSFVLTIIGTASVWYGRYASQTEQNTALRFAAMLARSSGQRPSIEREEDENQGMLAEVFNMTDRVQESIVSHL